MSEQIVQGSDEWFAARLGKITASRINDVMMGRDKAGYQNYRAQLACERLTGAPTATFKSRAMEQGNEVEPQARAVYEMVTGRDVSEVGFVPHPAIEAAGASPDGLVGVDGLVQIKCPEPKTHIHYLLGGTIPKLYRMQVQWEMGCADRKWCDFASFNSDFPPEMQLFISGFERDSALLEEMTEAVIAFDREVDEMVADLSHRYPRAA